MCYAVFEVNDVLIEFSFKNFRSFRDEAILSMEAAGLGARKSCLIEFKNYKLLPAAAIFGKNGAGLRFSLSETLNERSMRMRRFRLFHFC